MMGSLINCLTVITFVTFNVVAYTTQDIPNSEYALRIVGGVKAKDGQFPYAAGLLLTTRKGIPSVCGGSLISATSILTAAHCLQGQAAVKIVLGARNIIDNSTEKKTQTFIISNNRRKLFIIHPNYDDHTLLNDIAIIKLPHHAKLNKHVKLIPIPTEDNEAYDGESSIVMGWGETSDATGTSGVNTKLEDLALLHYETNTILSNTECKTFHPSYKNSVKDTNICQSGAGRNSTCKGDSGSPLVVNGVQVGIMSLGSKKCESGHPTIYTRLKKLVNNNRLSNYIPTLYYEITLANIGKQFCWLWFALVMFLYMSHVTMSFLYQVT